MTNLALIDAEHPWPGLLPFTEEARAYFCGRDSETDDLFRLIEREPLTVLFGQSGLGKSSLLNAGVFPRLRRAGYLPVYLRLNLDANARPLIDQVWQRLNDECGGHEVSATGTQSGDSFWEYLHRPDTCFLNPHGRPVTPVLVFDQFEELFTIGRQTSAQSARCQSFLQELGELIENRLPPTLEAELTRHPDRLDEIDLLRQNLKIVFAFREDYLADFESLKTLIRPIMQNRMRLTPMKGNRAAQAIRQAGAGKVSDVVAGRIVRFVGGAGRDETVGLEFVEVEPALLSLVCRELNEQRLQRREAEINADLIQGDNAQQIIEQFYSQGFAGLDKKVRYFVEDRLLTAAGFRDSCALDNALTEPGIREVALQTLVDRRILRREERGGLVRLELIHDVLARVAKTSRDQRREAEVKAVYDKMLAGQRRQKRWLVIGGVFLIVVQGLLGWLVWDVIQLKAQAKHNFAMGIADKAERAFSERRFNEAQIFSGHALADLNHHRAYALVASLNGLRAASPVDEVSVLTGRNTAISSDGKIIASGNADGTLTLSDAENGKLLRTLSGHSKPANSIVFSPDGHTLASGSKDNGVRIWDVSTGLSTFTLEGHQAEVLCLAFSANGAILASGSRDRTVRLWDTTSGKPTATMSGHANLIRSVAISPDGKSVASASIDKTIRLWSVASGKVVATLSGHREQVNSVAYSPDGRTLASGSDDRTIRLWDISKGMPAATLIGHVKPVISVAFSPDGKHIASGSWDNTLRIWDVASRRELRIVGGHPEAIDSVAYFSGGKKLISSAGDTVRLWSLESGQEPTAMRGHEDKVVSVAFSPDGRIIATGSRDNTVALWNVSEARRIASLSGHRGAVTSIAFSPDGRTLASASEDKTVRLWNVAAATAISTLAGHKDIVRSIAFSPDGHTLASASDDKIIRLWELASGKTIVTLTGHEKPVSSVTFSPDGRTVVSASMDKTVRFWDIAGGRELRVLRGSWTNGIIDSLEYARSVAFSPDGKLLAAGYDSGRVKLLDSASGNELRTLGSPSMDTEGAAAIAFSADGKKIVATSNLRRLGEMQSADSVLQLWEVASGNALGLPIEAGGSAAFSPDGKWLATGSRDNSIRVWPIAPLVSLKSDWEKTTSADEARYGLRLKGFDLVAEQETPK